MRKKSTTSVESRDSTVLKPRKKKTTQSLIDIELHSIKKIADGDSQYSGILPHSRTDALIQDYLEFKAARTIQKYARCWYVRLIYRRKVRAAKIIQHAWRGFYYPRWYYRFVENVLQQRLVQHYHDSATKIAAWWRGWQVRLHVHDHYALMREQLRLAEELLQCVAYKLHHLIRTKQIPGIYSLRKSQAFSKIEKLIAAFTFSQFHSSDMHKIQNAKLKPFEAVNSAKNAKCIEFFKQKELDEHMHRILKLYDNSMDEDEHVAAYYKQPVHLKRKIIPIKPVASFCTDIINVLNRWQVLTDADKKFDVNSIKDPEKLDKFLTEVRCIYDRMMEMPCK